MCSCTRNASCRRCREDDYARYHRLMFEDGPESPDEQRERLTQEHNTSVVLPSMERR